jgi:hypothetical protein
MISRRTVAAVAALALTTLGTLSGAAAAPAVRSTSSGYPTGIRPIKGGSDAGALVDGTATVRKAETTVTLPRTVLRSYANETSRNVHNILYSQSPAWAVTRVGRHPRFGIFPVAHSTVLGFGAIPISADLHLTQIVRNHQIVPIVVISKSQTVFPFKAYPTHVRGTVDVRVSNVFVDQVPLHVGPNCHTTVPMHLDLVGRSPAYNLFQGGPLRGDVTIPPFTGCGTGGDDLDPLLDGTISGPGNKIVQHQGNLAPWNTSQPNDCGGCRPPKH